MKVSIYILFSLFALTSCQKFTWNNPYDIATPKSVFTPDGLAVRQEGENLLLSWSQDNSNISGFKLFRSIDRGVSTELVSLNKSTLSYTDANIQGGKTYTYTLKAYADKNESNEVSTEILAKSRPTINTIAASAITENTATSGGAIVSDGGSPITSKGLVWSTSVNPTIDLTTKTNDGNGNAAFERILTNLSPSTIYYLRAYATNSVGTAYGNQLTFTTGKPSAPPILESLNQGLVAYYPFNGNANDESGNGNNGVLGQGITSSTDRKNQQNASFNFTGKGDVTLTKLPTEGSQDFSISAWLKVSSQGVTNGIVCWGQDSPWASAYFFILSSGKLKFDFAFNGGPVSLITVTDNIWHQVLVTNQAGLIQLYIDGNPSGNPLQMFPNIKGPNKAIGSAITNTGLNYFVGMLDDIRIYNRALTQEEITYLANN